MRIVLLGAPGSGKGTQGHLLSQHYAIPNISTGDILREAVVKGTKLGLEAKKNIDTGQLVPDDIMIGIVKQRLLEKDCINGFILDGFPRTVAQAKSIDDYLTDKGFGIQYVIALEVNHKKIIQRLTSRRVCRYCGKDFNVITNPPPANGKCDRCGGEIWQRPDDDEATIIKRLKVYEQKTLPLKNYYKQQGKLKIIQGDSSIEDVQREIWESLSINDNSQEPT